MRAASSTSGTTRRTGSHAWATPEIEDLLEMLWRLRSREELRQVLRDLCTLSELEALAHRWQVAQLLDRGLPYQRIAGETGASTATVTRVAYWLRHGEGGYRLALRRRGRSQSA
jgi:TrpR-related protein YerC/YecD